MPAPGARPDDKRCDGRDCLIRCATCSRGEAGYGAGQRLELSVSEYVSWWHQHKAGKDERLLYLKDWHFAAEFPGYKVSITLGSVP